MTETLSRTALTEDDSRRQVAVAAPRYQFVISPPHGPLSAFRGDLFGYRDLLRSFVRRDLFLRYKQTLLGPLWIILQPLLSAGVFSFLFASVAHIALPPHVPYFVFALTGLALWTGFSGALNRGTSSFVGNTGMLTKIYFPRFLLPVSAAFAALVDCCVMLVVALVVAVISGVPLRVSWLAVVPIALVLVGFAMCVGAALGGILVRFRDINYALPVAVQALLFVTPVLYPLATVPAHFRVFVEANPAACLLEALRWAVFSSPFPSAGLVAYSLAVVAIACFASAVVFSYAERNMADVI